MEEKTNECRILRGKPEGKRPLRRPRCCWKGNIKMDLREIVWGGMDWIDLTEDRDKCTTIVITVINLLVFMKC
jgi:hypothetical protein